METTPLLIQPRPGVMAAHQGRKPGGNGARQPPQQPFPLPSIPVSPISQENHIHTPTSWMEQPGGHPTVKPRTEQRDQQQRGPIPTEVPRGPQHGEGTTPSLPPGIPRPAGTEVRMAPPAPELAPSCVAKQRMQLVN